MKDIELSQVIHLYLGCEVFYNGRKHVLNEIKFIPFEVGCEEVSTGRTQVVSELRISEIKPILRSLDSMTEEEGLEYTKNY